MLKATIFLHILAILVGRRNETVAASSGSFVIKAPSEFDMLGHVADEANGKSRRENSFPARQFHFAALVKLLHVGKTSGHIILINSKGAQSRSITEL
jgi:hypothetical protein